MPNNIKLVKWGNIFNSTISSDKAAIVMTEGSVNPQDLTDIKDALGLGDVVTLNTSEGGNGIDDEGFVPVYNSIGSLPTTSVYILVDDIITEIISTRSTTSTLEIPGSSFEIIPTLPEFEDSTAADAAVSIGDVWWDSTLLKARVRLS